MAAWNYRTTPDGTDPIPCEWWEGIERNRAAEVYSWTSLTDAASRQLERLGDSSLAKYADQSPLFADMEEAGD